MPTLSRLLVSSAFLACLAGCQAQAGKPAVNAAVAPSKSELIARGEYLIRTTGCNDCHTAAYGERQGNVPTAEWLTGSPVGFQGPWGTTYAPNLRLRMQEFTEAQWLEYSAHLRTRPIMPDFAVRAMTEEDRRAIYHFVQSLGPAGQPAPAYLPPGQTPPPPYFALVLPPPPAGATPPASPATGASTP